MIELFIAVIALMCWGLLAWAFKALPTERWQFVASVPLSKHDDGHWKGLNLTFYGALTALSYVVSISMMTVMASAVSVPFSTLLVLISLLLVVIVPSSRWVAQLVEGKQATFTVAGAVFVAVLVCPVAVLLGNKILLAAGMATVPVLPLLAAMAISYAFGEGIGRIACISFGCCYGRPVTDTVGFARALFTKLHFVFEGNTKKIAYESQLDGIPVIPIQALTATLYIATALTGFWLYLHGWFATTIILTMGVTQIWRVYSENLRADFRGGAHFSPYQLMALATLAIALIYAFVYRGSTTVVPDLTQGLATVWSPGALLALQVLGIVIFVYTGRSEVTQSRIDIHVCSDKI
jgi:prolipoprotein diacylglyceryltransferase